ncbi:hypothetical protein [Escherichia coli]|uniref:hypothetical protein n=1 Tax=Escherichia coli TaxID=562 RepID=UPI00190CE01F|nr:hypothetical protein [Escherichia coli]MBK2451834.1 hypothetical protein [Escherichia coli]
MNWTLLGGSLAAVLALAGIAAWLKLGGDPLTEADALDAAGDMLPGFVPEAVLLGSNGAAALVRGREGRVALVKRHGAQPAVRELVRPVGLTAANDGAIVRSGDRMFGDVVLHGRALDEVEDFIRDA